METIPYNLFYDTLALKTLLNVRKMRHQASGYVNQPTVTHDINRGHHTEGVTGVSD